MQSKIQVKMQRLLVIRQDISDDYMCCDDTQLFQTHILDKDTQMPECSKSGLQLLRGKRNVLHKV